MQPAGKKRRPGIKWIIEKMSKQDAGGITPEEQKHLRILRSKKLKDSSYQKRKRKMQLLNITPKQKEILERRTRVIELKRDGRRNKYIADKLGLDKSMVTRDLQYIRTHAWQFKKELKEIMDELLSNLNTTIFTRYIRYDEQKRFTEWLESCEIMLN